MAATAHRLFAEMVRRDRRRRGRRAIATWMIAPVLIAACTRVPPSAAPQHLSRSERTLWSDLDRIFNAAVMEQGLWGVEIKSLDTGRVLYALNARKLMMPASNMKIVTLAAAAETLGWDYRFKTTLETAAPVRDGTLEGDLIVRGTGDPTINTRGRRAAAVFDEWAAALRGGGIERIAGGVLGDDNAFDEAGLGQGWSWDYLQDGYAAPVGALQFNEDIATLLIRPGLWPGDSAAAVLTPGAGLTLVNRITTGPPKSAARIDIGRRSHDAVLELTGVIAVDAEPVSRDVAVVNPTAFFAQAARDALIARGITVGGGSADMDDTRAWTTPAARRTLAETLSPPLRDIAGVMMKVSQNLYAETLLKAVGAAKTGTGSVESGRTAAADLFRKWGILSGGYVEADGSGLSRYDFVTADMLVTLLDRLHRDERHRDAFTATLPVAGKDGTISTRMKGTRAEANAVAKTGSISNVRALSGYVRTRDGETLAFSMLANSFTIPAATVNWIADVAVERLADYGRR